MAKLGYVGYLVSAHLAYHPDKPRPLNNLNGGGENLATLLAAAATRRHNDGVTRMERYEHAFRIDKVENKPGHVLLDAATGPYGVDGKLVDVDNGEESAYDSRKAVTVDLRALLAVCEGDDDYTGALLCERLSSRTLRNVIEFDLLKLVADQQKVTFKVRQYVDRTAWASFVDNAVPYELTSIYRSTRQEDYSPEQSRPSELRLTATGGLARRRGREVLARALAAIRQETPADAAPILIEDLRPQDMEGFTPQKVILKAKDDKAERTLVIEGESLPQWVYEFGGERRPNRVAMRQAWLHHAAEILTDLGSTVPDQWRT